MFCLAPGESLLIYASGDCGTVGTGLTEKPVGFVTGWVAKQPENPFAPPPSIQSIQDWQEKILQTAVYYVQKNVTRMSGVTTYLIMFISEIENAFGGKLFSALAQKNPQRAKELEQFYQEDDQLKIPRIWPNLLCLSFAGVDPYKYKNWIENHLPNSIIFQTYIGSEGLYGFQYDINAPDMVLMPQNAFYEFLELDEYINWKFHNGTVPNRHTVADVKTGKEYVFCISNYLGFTTYIPGDVLKIVSTKPLLFLYSRRLSGEVNISAEKINENHISVAISEASSKHQCTIREYLCTAVAKTPPHYVVAIEFSTAPQDLAQFATDMEQFIFQSNISYAEVRKMNALGPLRVINLPAGEFGRYILTKTQAGEWNPGQKKLSHLTDRQDFLHFCQSEDEGVSRLR